MKLGFNAQLRVFTLRASVQISHNRVSRKEQNMANAKNSPLTDEVFTRAPYWKDVPDEKWMDWRWQMSHRLNGVDELRKVINAAEKELEI